MTTKTIQATLRKHKNIEADLLLARVLGSTKEFLYLNPSRQLTVAQETRFKKLAGRRIAGEPIAYLVGYKYFYNLKFKVNKSVLIPRPETEWLVDKALSFIHSKSTAARFTSKGPVKILDIGTGSGCIPIGIAHALNIQKSPPKNIITASDISKNALTVARQNAKDHKTNIHFLHSNLFGNIKGEFDIIIANLPYVPLGLYEMLYETLKYEPKLAITDGGETWDIYNQFFIGLPRRLKPKGVALLEIDDGAKPALTKILKTILPRHDPRFHKDSFGRWRYLELRHENMV